MPGIAMWSIIKIPSQKKMQKKRMFFFFGKLWGG